MTPWTCPFCALLCDRLALAREGGAFALHGSRCPRALRALAQFDVEPAPATPRIDGAAATLEDALQAAATVLADARQPLFGGLATDIAGARALYALANACGAILDHAAGDALLPGLRTLQDRGLLQTTLAEIRNRADLLVFFGTQPGAGFPEFYARCGSSVERELVYLGTEVDPAAVGLPGATLRAVPWAGDAYTTVALLNALAQGRRVEAPTQLAALVQRMTAARYVVAMWEPAALPGPQPALLVEAINRLLKTLNATTRAGGLALAGNDGALTVNQTLAWLSGLPLRTGVHASGLAHDPHRYATARLLAGRAVDALLWVASFTADCAPPPTDVPTIVVGHPALAPVRARVFIPAATPGIGAAGHLFRLDGTVVVPLTRARADGLPTVAQAVEGIAARLRARAAAA
jgi:formylmethanofuran dehydrogenase subunit B